MTGYITWLIGALLPSIIATRMINSNNSMEMIMISGGDPPSGNKLLETPSRDSQSPSSVGRYNIRNANHSPTAMTVACTSDNRKVNICKRKEAIGPLIVPKRSFNIFFKHFWNFIRLLSLPCSIPSEGLSKFYKSIKFPLISSTIPLTVVFFATSEFAFGLLRNKWAFQGEVAQRSIETFTRIATSIYAAELIFRAVILRYPFYKTLLECQDGDKADGRGKSLRSENRNIFGVEKSRVIDFITESVIISRICILTIVHYILAMENWNTASFIIDPRNSRLLSKFSKMMLAMTILNGIVNFSTFNSLKSLLGVEHLLDPVSYRSNTLQIALFDQMKRMLHNFPSFIQNIFCGDSTRLVIKAMFFIDYLNERIPFGIEWPHLLLNLTLALSSNSAAGLYLSAIQFICACVDSRISNLEKRCITYDIESICHLPKN